MSILVERKYKVLSKIGQGSFGKIFKGVNINTDMNVAIKIEKKDSKMLVNEAKIYKLLDNITGIPRLLSFGKEGLFNYLVIDLLDESLDVLRVSKGGTLPLEYVLSVSVQIIKRIEMIHKRGILHRDIKPENFVLDRKTNNIYIIDFGLAKRYLTERDEIIPVVYGRKMTGTVRYASINIHDGLSASRRDDLESIGYMLVYLLIGKLPWQGIKTGDQIIRYKRIGDKKKTHVFENIPQEFNTYLTYCKRMKFDEEPDYEYCISLFNNLINKME
jgi:serine/threonine protein kinase